MRFPEGTRAGRSGARNLNERKQQMTRNLKVLGLALVAMVAMSALGASTASALETQHKFKGGQSPTTFGTVEQHPAGEAGEQKFEATTNDEKILKCKKLKAKGSISGEVESVTITNVEYTECGAYKTANGELIASTFVEFTECDYVFYGKTTETPSGTAGHHATAEIKCPVGQEVHIKVTALKLKCITLPEQKVHGIKYTNVKTGTKEEVTVNATAHGIKSTTEDSVACPTPEGKTIVHETGTYTGSATVKGYTTGTHTTQTDVTVTPGTT
jgi:hypothetical protein